MRIDLSEMFREIFLYFPIFSLRLIQMRPVVVGRDINYCLVNQ